jgi:hydroxymethylpyrimidine pyrophosphatase-like HAD family hydrolase
MADDAEPGGILREQMSASCILAAVSIQAQAAFSLFFPPSAIDTGTRMIKLISTDFDGTLFAEFEVPPVPVGLQNLIDRLQKQGAKWVINTGRDLSSLMEALGRSRLLVKPDFLVLVEREIYSHRHSEYVEDAAWNRACDRAHAELFTRVRADVPRLRAWVEERFGAIYYEDAWSPFCLIAEQTGDANVIHEYLADYCRTVPHLSLVRNDVCSRFSHEAFNKGTALAEIARQLGVTPEETFAAGDHLNDLPMLLRRHACWLAAPGNAVDAIKEAVRGQNGYVSELTHGHGVAEGLEFYINAEC